jgi:hypothetical protein
LLSLIRQDEKLGVFMYEERINRQKQDDLPYQQGTGGTMNGLQRGSFNITVLLHGQKMDPGATALQSICSTASFGLRQ